MTVTLSPTQTNARDALLRATASRHVAVLLAGSGMGKTTILDELQRVTGAARIGAAELVNAFDTRHPLALEEAFYRLISDALDAHEHVIVDDLQAVTNVTLQNHAYPRTGLLMAPLIALTQRAVAGGQTLVLALEHLSFQVPGSADQVIPLRQFTSSDYAHIATAWLGEQNVQAIDFGVIHRYARNLTGTQLKTSCLAMHESGAVDTARFLDYLRAHELVANVNLGEVRAVRLEDLKGLDDVLEALEANVVLPLENADLATELGLKAKRGVLLVGPPGTGKTTVGRALAHRLKSKFFLIDGTVVSGTGHFHGHVHAIFEAAKRSAPAIIFIDDSDVLFEGGAETGFYRYLLTILDGIESETVGRICLMMTAMDVGNLPPALVRSGRIELWLEMRLPNEAARTDILTDLAAELPQSMGALDIPRLVDATEGLSGADLRRLLDDGKLLFAFDKARGRAPKPVVEYFLQAVHTVVANKARYAEAESRVRAHRPSRPSMFDMMGDFAMAGHMSGGGFGTGQVSMVNMVTE